MISLVGAEIIAFHHYPSPVVVADKNPKENNLSVVY